MRESFHPTFHVDGGTKLILGVAVTVAALVGIAIGFRLWASATPSGRNSSPQS